MDLKSKSLLRISSEVYCTTNSNERLTDTIIEVKELSGSSGSSSGCCLILTIWVLLAEG